MAGKATIFIIAGTLDGQYPMGEGMDEKLSSEDLRRMSAGKHISLDCTATGMRTSVKARSRKSRGDAKWHCSVWGGGLPMLPILAYPYGTRPEGDALVQLKKRLSAPRPEGGLSHRQ